MLLTNILGHLIPLGIPPNTPDRTDNDLFFRVLDLRLVECILCGRIHNCRLTKDGRKVFLDIDDYKQSKFSEETCVTNDWDKFTSLRPISKFSGGKEAFINQWF